MADTLSQFQSQANPQDWATATNLANKYGIPPNIFQAMIAKESSWNPSAMSPNSTSVGYGQLTAGTASDLGVNPLIPSENLEGSAKYLSQMFKKFGNWTDALAHYNQGPNATSPTALANGQKYASAVMAIANTSPSAGGSAGAQAPAGDAGAQGDGNSIGGILDWIKSNLANFFFLLIGGALILIAVLSSEKGQEVAATVVKTAAVA